jgi:hypothetical protein
MRAVQCPYLQILCGRVLVLVEAFHAACVWFRNWVGYGSVEVK